MMRVLFEAWQLASDLARVVQPLDFLALVIIAVGDDQHFRLDLVEALQNAARAKIGRTGRPNRADAGRRQHADDGLRSVMRIGGDAIAWRDTQRAQMRGQRGDLCSNLREGQRSTGIPLALEHNGGLVVRPRTQQVFREIQARVGKPTRARHFAAIDKRARASLAEDAAKIPNSRPEGIAPRKAPAMQPGVIEFLGIGRGFPAPPRETR